MGEGGAREKGETSGELRGEDAELSSALQKIKAVSVRLRWYRLNGLPREKENMIVSSLETERIYIVCPKMSNGNLGLILKFKFI